MIQKIHRQPRGLIITLRSIRLESTVHVPNEARRSQSSDDRAKDGAHEHAGREDCSRRPTGDGVPYVDDDAAADREWCAGKNSGEEAGDEKSRHVVGECLAEVEYDVDGKTYAKDDPAAEQL